MENEKEIKENYLKGMKVSELCHIYKIPESKLYNKIANNGWAKEKKELQRKASESIESIIRDATYEMIVDIRKNFKKATFTEKVSALRAINDINGFKKDKPKDTPKEFSEIPQFIHVHYNNNISDYQKLDKTANNETVIDIEAES